MNNNFCHVPKRLWESHSIVHYSARHVRGCMLLTLAHIHPARLVEGVTEFPQFSFTTIRVEHGSLLVTYYLTR